MSRGFIKEDDQEEIPIVPPRADLPAGVTNYVTPTGMTMLLDEKKALLDERNLVDIVDENDKRIAVNHINAKILLLKERIATAKVIDLKHQPQDEVRFGALVTLQGEDASKLQKYQIVGVDEAAISKGKIAFTSPVAKALIQKRVGDKVVLKMAGEDRVFEMINITYEY